MISTPPARPQPRGSGHIAAVTAHAESSGHSSPDPSATSGFASLLAAVSSQLSAEEKTPSQGATSPNPAGEHLVKDGKSGKGARSVDAAAASGPAGFGAATAGPIVGGPVIGGAATTTAVVAGRASPLQEAPVLRPQPPVTPAQPRPANLAEAAAGPHQGNASQSTVTAPAPEGGQPLRLGPAAMAVPQKPVNGRPAQVSTARPGTTKAAAVTAVVEGGPNSGSTHAPATSAPQEPEAATTIAGNSGSRARASLHGDPQPSQTQPGPSQPEAGHGRGTTPYKFAAPGTTGQGETAPAKVPETAAPDPTTGTRNLPPSPPQQPSEAPPTREQPPAEVIAAVAPRTQSPGKSPVDGSGSTLPLQTSTGHSLSSVTAPTSGAGTGQSGAGGDGLAGQPKGHTVLDPQASTEASGKGAPMGAVALGAGSASDGAKAAQGQASQQAPVPPGNTSRHGPALGPSAGRSAQPPSEVVQPQAPVLTNAQAPEGHISAVASQVSQAVVGRMAALPAPSRATDGTWTVSVSLSPPELGQVQASLSLGPGGLTVVLVPSTALAQQALQQASHQISQSIGGSVSVHAPGAQGGHGGGSGPRQAPWSPLAGNGRAVGDGAGDNDHGNALPRALKNISGKEAGTYILV